MVYWGGGGWGGGHSGPVSLIALWQLVPAEEPCPCYPAQVGWSRNASKLKIAAMIETTPGSNFMLGGGAVAEVSSE